MEIKEECQETLSSSRIVCEEKRSKITFLNPSNISVSKVIVDDCQIIDGKRCDYLIRYPENEHYIELKGSDVRHAFRQLERTITMLGAAGFGKRVSYVISSRSPLSSAEIQVFRVKFRKKFQSGLIVKNANFETKI